MFDSWEALRCSKCKKAFMGRKPAKDGDILCPDCLAAVEVPVVNDEEKIPDTVYNEFEGGSGDDGSSKN